MTDYKEQDARISGAGLRVSLAAVISTVLLAGCGGSSSEEEHTHTDIDTAGRLMLFDTRDQALRVLDAEAGELLQTFSLDGDVPRLYTSAGHRYGIAIQRDADRVSFVDGGLYAEDHGDHDHDYEQAPTLLGFTLNDNRPTHYAAGEDTAVLFFDGSDAASARLSVLADAAIANGEVVASLDLETNMHGVAKVIGDKLFTTYRDAAITGTTLPGEIERYSFDGDSFTFDLRYDEQCPGLHGAGANAHALAFGCEDGILSIDLHDSAYPATRFDNPEGLDAGARIGTIAAHPDVEAMVAIAGNQLFVFDPESATEVYRELAFADGVGRVSQGFDAHGEVFHLLGDDGRLRLFDPAADWTLMATVTVTDPLEEDSMMPAVAASAAADILFVLDPAGQRIVVVDSRDGDIVRTLDLDFPASGLAWLGLADEDHDHDDDDHDHSDE